MPSELEELVEFLHHGNTQVRQLAATNLVPYSLSDKKIFKIYQMAPLKDLKLLVKDYKEIAADALTMLINLSDDTEVLEYLAADDHFIVVLLSRLTNPKEPNANLIAMLLANLAKYDNLKRIFQLTCPPMPTLSTSTQAIDLLLDLFVKGADRTYNKDADFDYLAYLFADLSKHEEGRKYFITKQEYDNVVPLTKITVFTEHKSDVRRKGVASTIKNTAFDIPSHPSFLNEDEVNILPYLLLPIAGNEEYSEEDTLDMLPDLQLLPPDKQRDSDPHILQTHVETLILLSTTREGRDIQRQIKVYPIIRELHLQVEHDGVREACERLVQVLMRDEEGEQNVAGDMKALSTTPMNSSAAHGGVGSWASQNQEDSEPEDEDDDKIIEI